MNLGETVRDKLTAFAGVIVAETRYLHGSPRVAVQPLRLRDGLPADPVWFEVDRLEVAEEKRGANPWPEGRGFGQIPASHPPGPS